MNEAASLTPSVGLFQKAILVIGAKREEGGEGHGGPGWFDLKENTMSWVDWCKIWINPEIRSHCVYVSKCVKSLYITIIIVHFMDFD